MKYFIFSLLLCLTYGNAHANENSGEYEITIHTKYSCGKLPNRYKFKAIFTLYNECSEDKCLVSTNKNQDIVIKKVGINYLFELNDGMSFIKFKDSAGENDELKPNNKYFLLIGKNHLSGMSITDRVGKCTVIYFVDGIKVSNTL